MSDTPEAGPAPVITVKPANATAEEIAAIVAVFSGVGGAEGGHDRVKPNPWRHRSRTMNHGWYSGGWSHRTPSSV